MRRQISEHLTLYEAMKQAGLPWAALQYGDSGTVLQVCKKVEEGNLQTSVPKIQEGALRHLFRDVDFWEYITRLLQEGIGLEPVLALLAASEDEPLSAYPYERVKGALQEEGLADASRFLYLKYYDGYPLSTEQKKSLSDALSFLKDHTGIRLEALEEAEKKILWEPIFSQGRLKKVLAEKENLKELIAPGVLPLLKELEKYVPCGFCYGQTQWEQLLSDPEGIKRDFKVAIEPMKEEEAADFFRLWMGNEALSFDLKKLKVRLSQMTAEERHQMVQSRAAYINALYGGMIKGVSLDALPEEKEKILIYAVTQRKRHFLSMVEGHFKDFQALPCRSLLFDPDVYRNYLNINEINGKELEKCFRLWRMDTKEKACLTAPPYLFSELELLSEAPENYIRLFHALKYQRSDDRLRVFREVWKKKCIPEGMDAAKMEELGKRLSQKALSQWMQKELAHISGLHPKEAMELLCRWQDVKRFLPKIKRPAQVRYLLRNEGNLEKFQDFQELQQQILKQDPCWEKLKEEYGLTDEFITENKESIQEFLYENGAEIMYTFLKQRPEKREEIRRILLAELMGRFYEVKYFKDDLQREIDFPVSETVKMDWQENRLCTENGIRLWEEDRLLPVMQIGEVPSHTCLSYQSGAYNECLLSCFDSNKKVMQASVDGKLVFRAILRLTKGCIHVPGAGRDASDIQFADLTSQQLPKEKTQKEELVLFIERPYFSRVSAEQERKVVAALFRMLRDKAKKLQARLVISESYRSYMTNQNTFVISHYYLYISASKNGSQYMDSLGGKATLSNARSYGRSRFWMESEEKHTVEAA